jgi:hypothetical protein
MLVRSSVTAVALALCALFDGALAASSINTASRNEMTSSVSAEPSGGAIDALASFISGVNASTTTGQAKPTWPELEEQALALSRAQHAGRPETLRFCEPELKVCNFGIVWRAGNGTKMFLRQAEDMRGKPLEREVCEINSFGDVRLCVDWDTDARSRDMKDAKGHWYKVADQ